MAVFQPSRRLRRPVRPGIRRRHRPMGGLSALRAFALDRPLRAGGERHATRVNARQPENRFRLPEILERPIWQTI
nr:MAG TPA: hypothetical protein [Caudoviricetes sp.]